MMPININLQAQQNQSEELGSDSQKKLFASIKKFLTKGIKDFKLIRKILISGIPANAFILDTLENHPNLPTLERLEKVAIEGALIKASVYMLVHILEEYSKASDDTNSQSSCLERTKSRALQIDCYRTAKSFPEAYFLTLIWVLSEELPKHIVRENQPFIRPASQTAFAGLAQGATMYIIQRLEGKTRRESALLGLTAGVEGVCLSVSLLVLTTDVNDDSFWYTFCALPLISIAMLTSMAVFESFNPNDIEESEFTNLDEPDINHNITGNITENTMIIELGERGERGETGENSDLNNNQSQDETTRACAQNNI